MNKIVSLLRGGLLAAGLLLSAAAFAQLTANKTEPVAGDTLIVSMHAASARSDVLYVAVQALGAIYFIDGNGNLTPYQGGQATPVRRTSGVPAGSTEVFRFTLPAGMDLPVTFYAAYGQSGVDVLATAGALDMSSLSQLNIHLKPAASTASGPDGKALYATHCASCHGDDPRGNLYKILLGVSASVTKTAIRLDRGGMGFLDFISDSQHDAIARWIANPN